jgi:hypothetical protein
MIDSLHVLEDFKGGNKAPIDWVDNSSSKRQNYKVFLVPRLVGVVEIEVGGPKEAPSDVQQKRKDN